MKKLATYLALTAVVANLGVAAVFAQETAPVDGTQEIDCPTITRSFGTGINAPANFQIGESGTRPVSSSNDTVAAYNPLLQSAYFADNDALFDDNTDTLTINSNMPFSCGASGRNVHLTVEADRFNKGTGGVLDDLKTYGSDGVVGGTGPAEDYYYIFSVNTSAPAACTGECVLALGSVEPVSVAFNGVSNGFTSALPHNSAQTSGDLTALLHSSSGVYNTVTLYTATAGFQGDVSIPGLDYNLSLPSNVKAAGSYSSLVTYTLATLVS